MSGTSLCTSILRSSCQRITHQILSLRPLCSQRTYGSGTSNQSSKVGGSDILSDFNLVENDDSLVRVDGAGSEGFLVNNVHVGGSIIAYKTLWMMWKAKRMEDVTPESLALLKILKPSPDLVIFGSGDLVEPPPRETVQALKHLGVGIEVLTTVCSSMDLAWPVSANCGCVVQQCQGQYHRLCLMIMPLPLSKR